MIGEISKRILIGIIATVLFSLSLAIFAYEPLANRQQNHSYTTFTGLLIIYTVFSGPVFIIAGVIWSFVLDKISMKYQVKQSWLSYLIKLLYSILAGIISTFIFLYIISKGDVEFNLETFNFIVLGIIASLLYFHLLLISSSLFINRFNIYKKKEVN